MNWKVVATLATAVVAGLIYTYRDRIAEYNHVRRTLVSAEQLAVLGGHSSYVAAASFSPDGRRIVTGSDRIRFWDPETYQETATFGFTNHVSVAVFSPDGGRLIATAPFPGMAKVWDVETRQELATLSSPATQAFIPGGQGASAIVFSRDGRRIASATSSWVQVWDADKYQEIAKTIYRTDVASFSADGRVLLIRGERLVELLDATDLREIGAIRLEDPVTGFAVSPDGRRIVISALSGNITMWDAQTHKQLASRRGQSAYQITFSPDGRRLAFLSQNFSAEQYRVGLWNAEPLCEIAELSGHTRYLRSVAFSPDGRRLVSTSDDRTARIWSTEIKGEEDRLARCTR
jgi:WD40 repeat protein